LWVRSLDSLESRPLAGTEGAITSAFWSPDSRSLGFVAQGKLKKVNVSGGSPQTVRDFPVGAAQPGPVGNFRSGAWNSDGVILFGTAHTGLWRVSAAGGPLTEVTRLDPSRKELFHAGPWFLPGGRQFLYDRVGLNAEYNGTYLGSLDAKPEHQSTRRVLTNALGTVYVSGRGSGDGYLLFTREGSLMAQPFDMRLEPAGEAVSIVQGINFAGPSPGPRPFSASMMGVLAYRTGGLTENEGTITQLTWFDRTGKMLATAGDRGQYNFVALSPDGTRVAVSRVSPETARGRAGRTAYEIWVHDFARSTSTRLTSDPASDWLATWSPDGHRIIFSSDRGGSVLNLYRKAADGAGSEDVVFSSNEDKSAQDWSRDGKFLLYSVPVNGRRSFFPTASHDLWVLPLTPVSPSGNRPEAYLKTEFDESQARFSPDGRFVAYVSDESGRYEIYVRPFPTALGKTIISTAGGVSPRWRRDGKDLYYISADSKMMAVEVSTSPIFKAGIPRPLVQAAIWGGGTFHNVARYDVTADGKRFLINSVTADATPSAPAPITIVLNWTALLKK
jgi:eukaryotic-like serine/threonine-protein kinase